MSKHTPGPWVVPVSNIFRVLALKPDGTPHRLILDGSPNGYYGYEKIQWLEHEGPEMAANARLIAAAPTLLEACKQASELIGEGCDYDMSGDVSRALCAAIAQAESTP